MTKSDIDRLDALYKKMSPKMFKNVAQWMGMAEELMEKWPTISRLLRERLEGLDK